MLTGAWAATSHRPIIHALGAGSNVSFSFFCRPCGRVDLNRQQRSTHYIHMGPGWLITGVRQPKSGSSVSLLVSINWVLRAVSASGWMEQIAVQDSTTALSLSPQCNQHMSIMFVQDKN